MNSIQALENNERTIETIRTAKIGHLFDHMELESQCKCIYGGVSWPGKNPGFAVIIAMGVSAFFNTHRIYLLDEYESNSTRELVRKCGALDYQYRPSAWIGDAKNEAADYFIKEMNKDMQLPSSADKQRESFNVISTPIKDMNCAYPLMMNEIKKLLDEKKMQLFLKDSQISLYLNMVDPDENLIAAMNLGEYPAIEALAFAVIEIKRQDETKTVTKADIARWSDQYWYHH